MNVLERQTWIRLPYIIWFCIPCWLVFYPHLGLRDFPRKSPKKSQKEGLINAKPFNEGVSESVLDFQILNVTM
jgi:hypothetical protein